MMTPLRRRLRFRRTCRLVMAVVEAFLALIVLGCLLALFALWFV